MLNLRRHANVLAVTAALVLAAPVTATLAQNAPAPAAKTPSTPQPALPPMAPLTPEQVLARQIRGPAAQALARTQPPFDWSVSKRSDFDKNLPNPYAINQAWYAMPKGRYLGGISAIDMDKDGKSVWIAERCGGRGACGDSHVDPIMKFSADGKVLTTFGKDMIAYPHGMYVDRDGNIWVTDLQSNLMPTAGGATPPKPAIPRGAQVLKFSPQGKLLMRLGEPGVYGTDEKHFSQPSDVVTDPEGNIYVADGHDSPPANNRIVKFDKTGKFIKSWPTCHPSQARQIDCSHSIAIDSQGRLFVANRGNNVIDIFDREGKMLAEWPHMGKPTGIFIDKNDIIYVADSQTGSGNGNSFVKGVHVGNAKTGEVTAFLPDPLGNASPWSGGGTLSPEGVAVDKDGRIITGSVTPPGMAVWTLQFNTKVGPPQRGGAAE